MAQACCEDVGVLGVPGYVRVVAFSSGDKSGLALLVVERVVAFAEHGIAVDLSLVDDRVFAGVPLTRFSLGLDDCLLVAVTEKRTKEEMDKFVAALGRFCAA